MSGAGPLRLPPVLRAIADATSVTTALKLAQEKGGIDIYVPRRIDEDHWLAQLVGLDHARAIQGLYGGENVSIPLGLTGSMQEARARARQALDAGASVAQAARAAGMTERGVYKLRDREAAQRPRSQGDLFD